MIYDKLLIIPNTEHCTIINVLYSIVLVQPIGHVAYPGTTVHYSCEGTTTFSALLNINNELAVGRPFPNTFIEQQYQNRQFSWTRTPAQGGTTVRWDLNVVANEQNNNTRISCTFDNDITRQAVLVVVNGECMKKQKKLYMFSSHRSTRPSCSSNSPTL